jgi:hypothetical protein
MTWDIVVLWFWERHNGWGTRCYVSYTGLFCAVSSKALCFMLWRRWMKITFLRKEKTFSLQKLPLYSQVSHPTPNPNFHPLSQQQDNFSILFSFLVPTQLWSQSRQFTRLAVRAPLPTWIHNDAHLRASLAMFPFCSINNAPICSNVSRMRCR